MAKYSHLQQPMTFSTNPAVTGPGLWFFLHLKAYHATTEDNALELINDLWLLAKKHPCIVCRKHMGIYLNKHPPRDHIEYIDNTGRNVGIFRYTWLFHNFVNQHLKKPIMSFDDAISQFEINEDVPCTEGCGGYDYSDYSDNEYSDDISEYHGEPTAIRKKYHPGVQSYFTVTLARPPPRVLRR